MIGIAVFDGSYFLSRFAVAGFGDFHASAICADNFHDHAADNKDLHGLIIVLCPGTSCSELHIIL